MPLDFEALSDWDFEEIWQSLTERDTILYALGLDLGGPDRQEGTGFCL